MIRNKDSQSKFFFSLLTALILHAAILSFLKYDEYDFDFLSKLTETTKNAKEPIKLDEINFVKPEDMPKFRKVGVKDGKKDLQRPDLPQIKRPSPPPVKGQKGAAANNLSLKSLAPELPKPEMTKKVPPTTASAPNQMARNFLHSAPAASNNGEHFYFNYKEKKIIPRSEEQEILKNEASKRFSAPSNKATERISNFEIRYERPEGVSEDELNSDEKAYYSFYVRSYQNYFSKIYANYEKIVVERPNLSKVFDRKHLLIGKIDYDEEGNIIKVKILKSSEDDDLHYFFEETLKQLNQPNPPRVFTKGHKQFSIYYQLQIN